MVPIAPDTFQRLRVNALPMIDRTIDILLDGNVVPQSAEFALEANPSRIVWCARC